MSAVVGCHRDVFDFNFSTAISNLLQPHTTALPLAINFMIQFYYMWNRFGQFMGFCDDFDDILPTLIQSPNFNYFGFFYYIYLQSLHTTDYFTYVWDTYDPLDGSPPNPTVIIAEDKKCCTLQLLQRRWIVYVDNKVQFCSIFIQIINFI